MNDGDEKTTIDLMPCITVGKWNGKIDASVTRIDWVRMYGIWMKNLGNMRPANQDEEDELNGRLSIWLDEEIGNGWLNTNEIKAIANQAVTDLLPIMTYTIGVDGEEIIHAIIQQIASNLMAIVDDGKTTNAQPLPVDKQ